MADVIHLPTTIEALRRMLTYSRESAERLMGVHGQDREIEDWGEEHGYEIVGYARDNRVNGLLLAAERPGLSAAIAAVEEHKVAGIIVRSFDRLARDFAAQDDALKRIWAAGGRFFTVMPDREWKRDRRGDDSWTSRKAYADRYENEYYALLERLQNGRREKMKRGGYGGGHRLRRRYGVELVEIQGKLEYRPIPAEQDTIERICREHYIGMTLGTIARRLNEEGIPTATGAEWSRKVVRDLVLRGPDGVQEVFVDRELPAIEWVARAAG